MDDVPASPTRPGPRGPILSVVVPVHDGGDAFKLALRGLRDAITKVEGPVELIVVDDGSNDDSALVAKAHGALVLRNETPEGPASARNRGAKVAQGTVLAFLDADVVAKPQTLKVGLDHMARHGQVVAVFGSYDDDPPAPGLVSRFRNLLHHHVHQTGDFDSENARPAHTFWTGCGMIDRAVFLEAGGFDAHLYARPAIEDVELGYRLHRAGRTIHLKRDMQVAHHKRWTLASTIKTDVFGRGVPWLLLQWRMGVQERDLNVSTSQKACALAVAGASAALAVALIWPWALTIVPLALAYVAWENRGLYARLARRGGRGFAFACLGPHVVYYLCCLASVPIALALRQRPKARRPHFLAERPHRWTRNAR